MTQQVSVSPNETCDHTDKVGRRLRCHRVGGINPDGMPFCEWCLRPMQTPAILGGQGRTADDLAADSRALVTTWAMAMAVLAIAAVAWRLFDGR